MSASLSTVLHSPCQWRPVSLHGAAQPVSVQAFACLCNSHMMSNPAVFCVGTDAVPQNVRCGNLRAEEKEAVIECCRLNARVVLIAPQHGPRPQEGPKETQKWYQRGPNMVPNIAQDGPTRTQDGPKWPQDGPSTGLGSILAPLWLHFGALSGSKNIHT